MSRHQELTVYIPNQKLKTNFFQSTTIMCKNIFSSKELIIQLFKRDFFAIYKKSFIGTAWIFLSPLVGVISWIFMNSIGLLSPGDVKIPYPAYVLISNSIWGAFMGFYHSSQGTLSAGTGFILQVNYPHESLLIKQIGHFLATFILGFLFNIIVLVMMGVIPSWKILFFPFLILPLFFLGGGIGLILSVLSIVAVDISKAINYLLGLIFFVTPVIYAPNFENPILQTVLKWNPLTHLITGIRDTILYGTTESYIGYIYATIFSVICFFVACRLFYLSEDKVIEKMI